IMLGGTGDDTYVLDSPGDEVVENANAGNDTIMAPFSYTLGLHLENLVLTGTGSFYGAGNAYDNRITANNSGDSLFGAEGNDTLTGGTGNDYLDGGTGIDTMAGGAGDDTYIVDNAADKVIEAAGGGNDAIRISVSYVVPANVETIYMDGNSAINADARGLTTNIGLFGNGASNQLWGGSGNDYIDGGAGADVMTGGAGNDTYIVDNSGDQVVESANGGDDMVMTSANWAVANNVETVYLTGTANLWARGNATGGSVYGNDGNNTLESGTGNNRFTGGNGYDTFVLNAGGHMTITDFRSGTDKIDLSAFHGQLGSMTTSTDWGGILLSFASGETIYLYSNYGITRSGDYII
ncbi:hypothetical protein M0638_25865, partial [Roseomonas sp. NAR14]